MAQTLLRGRTLSFLRWPEDQRDLAACRYEEDGGLLLADGRIAAAGSFAEVAAQAGPDALVIDHRPHLIVPGFIDAHAHFPQMQVIASWGAELLDWLNDYTFPEETRFSDPAHCRRIARLYLDEMVRNGTTTAATYCSVHKASAQALFAEAHSRDMLTIAGKVMMDRNAPDGLRDTPESAHEESRSLIAEWHGKGRQRYAVTPRFAITSSPAQMEVAGALMREFPDLHMQTHLSENAAEIALAQKLFPRRGTIPTSTTITACSARRRCSATASICPSGKPTRFPTVARWRCSARPRTSSSAPASSTTSATGGAARG
jgi:guanine deaminase